MSKSDQTLINRMPTESIDPNTLKVLRILQEQVKQLSYRVKKLENKAEANNG